MTALPHRRGDEDDEFFAKQPSRRSELPDPEPLLINLARSVIEVIAGARELNQIMRWVNEDVYKNLLKRSTLAARSRKLRGAAATRPTMIFGSTSISEPRDGAVEAVVIVHFGGRTRAVAIRLEGLDHRWRASAINVL